MPENPSADLVALCASILDDGEISADEAYQLAEWLNNHPEAAEHWPGRELIEPLQEIWADGVVTPRGLHRLARLLISAQREWARRPETQIISLTNQPAPHFSQLDLDDARLPSLQGTFRVPAQSEAGRFYKVDLVGPSCSCPDWRGHRSRLPIGDLSRCCKHILHVYAALVRKDADGWLSGFIENGWPADPKTKWHLLKVGEESVLFSSPSGNGWATVFAKAGTYARFGFNLKERRWAYGAEPEGAPAIAAAIEESDSRMALRVDLPLPPTLSYLPKVPPGPAVRRPRKTFRWPIGIAAIALAFVIVGGMILRAKEHPRFVGEPSIARASASPAAASKNVAVVASATAAPTASHISNNSAPPPKVPWNVKTLRAVRIKNGRENVTIPKGTQLHVVARSDVDLMVSYHGSTVTIPAGATDAR